MKSLPRLLIVFCACNALALIAFAGPESLPRDYKQSKEVAPVPPPPCDWTGFYFGLHAGGQFGHSEDLDDDYNFATPRGWGYSESGFVAGGQVGYNWQWGCLVLGPEFDIGYMNLDGSGVEPGSPGDDTVGKSDSDFYVTFRGRLGFAHDCWLFYATGGIIGVNYDTSVVDDCVTGDCGGEVLEGVHKQEFNWGPTVGGGIERMLGRHWSIKLEYLYYTLDDQSFQGTSHEVGLLSTSAPTGKDEIYKFTGETTGHIVRAGLNFRF